MDRRGLGPAPLFEEPRDVVLPAGDPLAKKKRPVRLADLASRRLLQDPATLPEWYAIATPEHRRPGQMAHTVEEKLELVAAQAGFVILPRSTTAVYRRPDVRVLPIQDIGPSQVTLILDAATDNPARGAVVRSALACRDTSDLTPVAASLLRFSR